MTARAAAPLGLLILILALAPAETARAGLLQGDSGGLFTYLHFPKLEADQAHDIDVVVEDSAYRLSDRGTVIVICGVDIPEHDPDTGDRICFGPPCTHPGGDMHEARCPVPAVAELHLMLGDLNDRVENQTALPLVACGGPGTDLLTGGDAVDVMGGGAGRDELRGGPGRDELFVDLAGALESPEASAPPACLPGSGSPSRELLDGGPGFDRLEGGPGDDTIRAGDDADIVFAYEGDDSMDGGDGGDLLLGQEGHDALAASAGNDFVFGGDGDDALAGGEGNDVLGLGVRHDADGLGAGRVVVVTGEGGDDRFEGGPGDDIFAAGPGEVLFDLINPLEAFAALRRGVLNPALESAALNGADHFSGGPGLDRVTYLNRTLPVQVSLDGEANDGSAGEGDGVDPDIEQIMGGSRDDVLRAALDGSSIFGGPGADTIVGGPGPDDLNGGADIEADVVLGAGGDDEVRGGPGDDSVDGGSGVDAVLGEGGEDQLSGGPGVDGLEGGPGDDVLDGGAGGDCLHGFVFAEEPAGSRPPACRIGDPASPAVGADGNDVLRGGPGADRLAGGGGEDVADYSLNRASVTVALPDAASARASAEDAEAFEPDDIGTDVEGVRGGRGHDLLLGNAGDNLLDGGPGDDQVEGGAGVDRLRGGSGRDLVVARDGDEDAVRCGTWPDLALTDGEDTVVAALSDQCERVDAGRGRTSRSHTRVGPVGGCTLGARPPGVGRLFHLRTSASLPPGTFVDATICPARIFGAGVARHGAFAVLPRRGRAHVRLRGGEDGCPAARARRRRLAVRAGRAGLVVHGRELTSVGERASWTTTDGCAGTRVRVRTGRVRVAGGRDRGVVLGPGDESFARSRRGRGDGA